MVGNHGDDQMCTATFSREVMGTVRVGDDRRLRPAIIIGEHHFYGCALNSIILYAMITYDNIYDGKNKQNNNYCR